MHEKLQTPYAKRMSRIRSKTVEPVLGHLINYLGMKRLQARGIKAAVKHVLMASLCHNLKRLMKQLRDSRQNAVNSLINDIKMTQKGIFLVLMH